MSYKVEFNTKVKHTSQAGEVEIKSGNNCTSRVQLQLQHELSIVIQFGGGEGGGVFSCPVNTRWGWQGQRTLLPPSIEAPAWTRNPDKGSACDTDKQIDRHANRYVCQMSRTTSKTLNLQILPTLVEKMPTGLCPVNTNKRGRARRHDNAGDKDQPST